MFASAASAWHCSRKTRTSYNIQLCQSALYVAPRIIFVEQVKVIVLVIIAMLVAEDTDVYADYLEVVTGRQLNEQKAERATAVRISVQRIYETTCSDGADDLIASIRWHGGTKN